MEQRKNFTIQFAPPYLGKEEEDAVLRVLRSGWLTTGKEVEAFEKEFAEFHGAKYGVAVSSCTAALYISLKIVHTHCAIIPEMTFLATASAAKMIGLGVRFVDADFNTGLAKIGHVRDSCGAIKGLKTFVPVHYAGNMFSQRALRELKEDFGVTIVQDAAHMAGSGGLNYDMGPACYSFYANKNMCTGEGGMILTNDQKFYRRAKELRLHGLIGDAHQRYNKVVNYDAHTTGFKCNMMDLQAALGRAQLRKLNKLNARRVKLAARYVRELKDVNVVPLARIPGSVPYLFPVRVKDRDKIRQELFDAGIHTGIHYPALSSLTCFAGMMTYAPDAVKYGKTTLSLPLHPGMSNEDVDYVVDELRKLV